MCKEKFPYHGHGIELRSKTPDEYIAYLEYELLESGHYSRCAYCERIEQTDYMTADSDGSYYCDVGRCKNARISEEKRLEDLAESDDRDYESWMRDRYLDVVLK